MKLVGLMPVRNEAYVLGLSARVALQWCDHLVILDHASTDASTKIILGLQDEDGGRTSFIRIEEPTWDEMRHRQVMLNEARLRGATHIAIIDADEILTSNLVEPFNIREAIEMMPRGSILQLPGYNLRNGLDRYHDNGLWGNRWFSCVFRDEPRLHWGGDQFHHREPMGGTLTPYRPLAQRQGGIMHLWGASERRLKARHALYKITERLRWPDKRVEEIDQMYSWAIHGEGRNRAYGTPETWTYAEVPAEWWKRYHEAGLGRYLDVEAEPWQISEVKRLLAEYGPEPFSRLDLFGIENE